MWVDKPEKEDDFGQQTDSLNSPSVGAGAGGGGAQIKSSETAANGTPSSMSPAANAPTQQFGTIQDYFKGNQQQGEQLGEKFSSKLDATKDQERGAIDTAATGAKNQIASNTIGLDQDLLSRTLTDPTKVANDANDYDKFTKQWNAAYAGPQSFETSNTYADAAKATQAAKDKATQLSSTGGRQQLIQDEFGVYGQGNKGLDEALLQQSSYFPQVQEKAKDFGSIQDYLNTQSQDINQAAKTAKDTTEQTKQQVRTPFENKLTGFKSDLDSRVADARNTANKTALDYQSHLNSGNIEEVEKDLASAGVSNDEKADIISYLKSLNKNYGVTPNLTSTFLSNPNVDINAANVATKQDYDTASALNKLTGVDYSGVLNPADVAKSGTSKTADLKSADLRSYLKENLGIQDKSLVQKGLPDVYTFLGNIPSIGPGGSGWNGYKLEDKKVSDINNYLDALRRATPDANRSLANLPPNLAQILGTTSILSKTIPKGAENDKTRNNLQSISQSINDYVNGH